MRDAKLRERAHRAHVNYWEDHLCLGHQRSKIVLHYQPPKPNTYPPVVVVHKYFGWRPPWMTLESSSRECHCYVTTKCNQVNQQSGSTCKNKAHWCPPSFHKTSPTKRGHFNWECGHQWSTCWYVHQATWWEKVLQAKEWIEHTWLLKYVLMQPYYMTCLSFEQSKVKLIVMSFIHC